jgi:dienelactone hydrolase
MLQEEVIDVDATHPVTFQLKNATVVGDITVPENARALIVFAHGSGSSRHSPRNKKVAQFLQEAGFATLLMDLLTPSEEIEDQITARLRFNIPLLAERLVLATEHLKQQPQFKKMVIGYFGASTGAAAALQAAAMQPESIYAVVSRGGRPDLAGILLSKVQAPTLLIVGGLDTIVIELNESAQQQLQALSQLEIVPGATHLFEEPGTLDRVSQLACAWFKKYLPIAPQDAKLA